MLLFFQLSTRARGFWWSLLPDYLQNTPGVNGDCVKFVRSFAACQNTRTRQRREHVNNITAYVDGSMIYGSTLENFRRIRKGNSRLFKFDINWEVELHGKSHRQHLAWQLLSVLLKSLLQFHINLCIKHSSVA